MNPVSTLNRFSLRNYHASSRQNSNGSFDYSGLFMGVDDDDDRRHSFPNLLYGEFSSSSFYLSDFMHFTKVKQESVVDYNAPEI